MRDPWIHMGPGWFVTTDDGGSVTLWTGAPDDPDPGWYATLTATGRLTGPLDGWPDHRTLPAGFEALTRAWLDGPADHLREQHDRHHNLDTDGVAT